MVTVFFELNGQPRRVKVPDRTRGGLASKARHKGAPGNDMHVGAPMPGVVDTGRQAWPGGEDWRRARREMARQGAGFFILASDAMFLGAAAGAAARAGLKDAKRAAHRPEI